MKKRWYVVFVRLNNDKYNSKDDEIFITVDEEDATKAVKAALDAVTASGEKSPVRLRRCESGAGSES